MEITIDPKGGQIAVVRLAGRLDLLSAKEVKESLATTVADGYPRLVTDLGEVSFIDSWGLGTLISGLKVTRLAGGDLRLARCGDQARLVLGLTSLDRVMRLYPTVEEALASY